jgi:hypothetical protein
MDLKNKFITRINEKWLFISVLLINIVFISSLKFLPSMDGPAHLYNSNILLYLLKDSSGSLNDYYTVNSFYIPNWLSHFLLAGFRILLPAWLAEKLLLIIYITGLSLTFRLLIKQLKPENLIYSIFIFPFAYSFLFHLGFYNYCLSFILFFFTLYYWLKTRNNPSLSQYIFILLLLILIYYANILTFLFLGFSLGIIIIAEAYSEYQQRRDFKSFVITSFHSLIILLIIALPGIILGIIFYTKTAFNSADIHTGPRELIKWLNVVRPLIVYNYVNEEILTEQILHLLIALFAISVYYYYSQKSIMGLKKSILNDFFIIPALMAFILLFIVPSGGFAGMMSDRLALMFYMILIVFVLSREFPKRIKYIFIPLILVVHFALLTYHFNSALRKLNKDAQQIQQTASKIPEGSIVLPIDMTENWLEIHFSNYLGTDKALIILENYEASVGWFPVKWNPEKIPNILLGNHSSINGISWRTNVTSANSRQIDFIFLYGNTNKIGDVKWNALNDIINKEYEPVYSSENGYIKLFGTIPH